MGEDRGTSNVARERWSGDRVTSHLSRVTLLVAMTLSAVFHLSPSGCGGESKNEPVHGLDALSTSTSAGSDASTGSTSVGPLSDAADPAFLLGFYRADLRAAGPLLVREGKMTQERLDGLLAMVGVKAFPATFYGLP